MNSSSASNTDRSSGPTDRHHFATTHWSVVLQAGRADSLHARDALAVLFRNYWYPLYAHVRRRGYSAHDAQDLTQEFFARLLAKETLAIADPKRGRFRSFILTALDHFMADEWEKARAGRRGGGNAPVSIDAEMAERRFELEATPAGSPDRAFDRQWALSLLATVLGRLEGEYRADGKDALFAELRPTLTYSRGAQPYREIAARLGTTEGAVKVAIHRLRHRYRALLEDEIAQTVATPADVSEEMRHLLRAIADA